MIITLFLNITIEINLVQHSIENKIILRISLLCHQKISNCFLELISKERQYKKYGLKDFNGAMKKVKTGRVNYTN